MTTYEIVPATFDHGLYIVNRLRQADIDEMWAAHHATPRQGVLISLAVSRDTSYTGLVDGKPICIYGVAQPSLMVDAGRPWMFGTDEIPKHSLKFLRENRKVVEQMQLKFPVLFNYVDARHEDAIAWLHWLGFRLERVAPYGPDRLPFHRFSMGEENV